ncbi:MAG: EAL domain-containing protein, partial [Thiotrichaceae bacterium]|nr:EAL domain-containing protein [Thiotrichaceae bacterium]
ITTTKSDISYPSDSYGKSLLHILLLTVLLTLIISFLYYSQLKTQFESSRNQLQLHEEQLVNLFNTQSIHQFKLLQKLISSISQVNQAIKLTDSISLIDSFKPFWSELKSTHNVIFTGFYDLKHQPIATWHQTEFEKSQQFQISGWIDTVQHTQKSQLSVGCSSQCDRYFISPILVDNVSAGYLVIALPLTNPLNSYSDLTNRVTGILSPALNPESSTDVLVFKWGYHINGNSIQDRYQSVLQEFAKTFPAITGNKQLIKASIKQHQYELNLYPSKLLDKSLLIVLDDVSADIKKLHLNVLQFTLITFVVLFSLLSLLLLTLKSNTHKLEKPSKNPTLDSPAKSTIDDTEHLNRQITTLQNNIASQAESSLMLNSQFDSLKKHNENINLKLAKQKVDLTHERKRVNKILDNTQAIIMQLQKDGTIAGINNFAESITGYSAADLIGKNFIDLYADNAPLPLKDLERLASMKPGQQQLHRHEAHIKRKDGKERIVLWLHTILECKKATDIPILSTGLDITQQKKLEKNLSWLINHDSLTSLYNRKRFERELDSALNWAKENQANGCLLTIDLDNFKDINDSCTHKVGDIILRKVAKTLSTLTKQIDSSANAITARLGSDEFALILRNFDEDAACIFSQRIIKALNSISHLQRQVKFQLSSCIGIASFSVAENNPTELLSNANYARNQAKCDGRNQYHIFQAEHSHLEQTHHRMLWRERIESALKNSRFVLHFQPILDIQQYKIPHYETLIRMLDENNELMAPGLFIHIAEQFGLIQKIDRFMISSAIAKQGELRRQGHDIGLTINLSGKAFDDPELFNQINMAIQFNNANPEKLIFEITETGAVSNIISAEKVMSKIQSLGCQFALDDFGIGFSSFNYLRKLPVDYVKIDGSFVNDLANNSDNKVLVQALSEVAIGFNKLTVAEFVDSRKTLDILKQAKINYAQGYFIGKPSEIIPVKTPDLFYSKTSQSESLH